MAAMFISWDLKEKTKQKHNNNVAFYMLELNI